MVKPMLFVVQYLVHYLEWRERKGKGSVVERWRKDLFCIADSVRERETKRDRRDNEREKIVEIFFFLINISRDLERKINN